MISLNKIISSILLLILLTFFYFIGFNNIKPSVLKGTSFEINSPDVGMILKGVHLIEKKNE